MSLTNKSWRPKIVFVGFVDLASPAGDTTHVKELIFHLRALEIEVSLVASASIPIDGLSGFHNIGSYLKSRNPLVNFFRLCLSLFRAAFIVLKLARRMDVIYVRDSFGGLAAYLAAKIWCKTVIYEVNGIAADERRAYGESLLNRLYIRFLEWTELVTVRLSTHYVTVTEQIKNYLVEHYYLESKHVSVIHNGVNTKMFRPLSETALVQLRQELRLVAGKKVIVFAGTLSAWQGVDVLLASVPHVLTVFPDAYFLIVGDGPLADDLHNQAKQLGISDNVLFTGWVQQENMPLFLNLADICVVLKMPLLSGYSPLKVYEYMACGKPTIASRVEGLEFLEQEGVGRLVDHGNPDAISKVLVEMLHDEGFCQRAGGKAAIFANQHHSWAKVAERVGKVCLDVVNAVNENGKKSQLSV